MKGCVQCNPVYGSEDFASSGARSQELTTDLKINRPVLNPLSYRSYCNRVKVFVALESWII